MPASKRGAAVVALILCILPAGARADELLVMPYACSMIGGQPVLDRGPEQSHRIVGPRDQRKFTACSPVNPGLCRTWTVHRFDLDCDGARVPWASVVAATNEGSRRAWLLDGRLVLRMGPRWSLAPDDPCARESGQDEGYGYRRMQRHCADRLAMAPPPVVELPFGYAPMLGIDGIFVKAAPEAAPGMAGDPPGLPPLAAGPPPPKSALGPPPQETPAPDLFQPPPAPQREPAAKQTAPPKAVLPPAPQIAVRPPPTAPGAAPSVAEAPKAGPPEAKPAAPPPPKPAQRPVAPAAKVAEAAPQQEAAQPAAPSPQPVASPDGGAVGVSLFSLFRTTTIGAIVAFGGLALGLLAAFALARRRESARDAARRRPRDLATVSLDRKRSRPPARPGDARGRPPVNAAVPAASRPPGPRADASMAAGTATVDLGERMPLTRAEALEVLGMGVAPSATAAALKKIVDGLRQSWHPDLARDDADRALRELRSKQINAAWDLLQSQRAEV
jgi:hypothetical protein